VNDLADGDAMERESLLEEMRRRVLVADGAMGTELMKRGIPSGAPPEEWNISHPEVILSIHKSYVEAGADIVLTNTFGANRMKLEMFGLGGMVARFNRRGAELAREAAGAGRFVLGDIGPTGQLVAPLGKKTFDEFVEVFSEQAESLAEGGVDGLIIETMMALDEAVAALAAAKKVLGLPVAVSMIFKRDTSGGGFHTVMGVNPKSMASRLESEGADIIGTNCGMGIREMTDLVREIYAATNLPVIAEPNAGPPQIENEKTVYRESAEEMAAYVPGILKAGVRILGGCCGTTAQHIRKVAEIVKGKRNAV